MNESTDYICEHGEVQFRFLEESRPEDFVLSFEQNITELLITAEFDELKGYFSFFAQILSDVNEELERYLAGEHEDDSDFDALLIFLYKLCKFCVFLYIYHEDNHFPLLLTCQVWPK
jgi:hypothetical protein